VKKYSEILKFLERDKILTEAISKIESAVEPELELDIYIALLNSIVSQQLSTKVVKIIWNRFSDLFIDGYPKAEKLLTMEHDFLRGIGLSNNKVRYLKNVAEFSLENDLSFEYLLSKSNEEIIAYLTQIKGVGKWTVQMILMFPMDRPNIFPIDDLGIQNGMKKLYAIDLRRRN